MFDNIGTTREPQYVVNPDATAAAQEKGEELGERFSEWVWEDPDRTRELVKRYNWLFNGLVLRNYNGVRPTFPGMASWFVEKIRPHQSAAVARIINEPAVLLGHEVGAGKTAEMVAGIMELRRLGMANKPAMIVPNHMLEQVQREFLQIYPKANVLVATKEDLAAAKRRAFVSRCATGDWDAVIIAHSSFERIPMSKEAIEAYMTRELAELDEQIERARTSERESGGKSMTVRRMENARVRAEERIKRKLATVKDPGITFEATGIDYLFVDEAHLFKNLRTPSILPGAAIEGSNRASDLDMKIGYLRERNGTRVATFTTATPIANSVTEAYVMQKYLRPDILEKAHVRSFDNWASTFGKVKIEIEFSPDGSGFRPKARFGFVNVQELLRMWHVSADIKTAEDLNLPTPALAERSDGQRAPENIVIPPSPALLDYVADLGRRAERIRTTRVDPSIDNMLKISSEGRAAALDMRLVAPGTVPDYATKVDAAADHIFAIWQQHRDTTYPGPDGLPHPRPGALQLVFLDLSTPKPKTTFKPVLEWTAVTDLQIGDTVHDDMGVRAQITDIVALGSDGWVSIKVTRNRNPLVVFYDDRVAKVVGMEEVPAKWSAYDELKAQLIARGMPEEKIRYIHDARNDREKGELFAACRSGEIAVLMGSTERMGVGTNVQARAVALHHIDCPWRPADLQQRDGRILRQGNLNPEVRILRYVTERSFDGFMWQGIERKSRFITMVMRGKLDVREMEDVGEQTLSANEVKAVATGNPLLLDLAEAAATRLERKF
ncbi:helicase-related protein [Nonomuraea soli]|uniref:Helicase n=1 Tax=Nonomuraea soli TaxID=1032476 RepID=A0A7W0CUR2_9ACTN|nr:helicase-related protein [Nonomuraea soli]MBA2897722.1 hypothetical protein [Nonomuraea soli]